MSRFGTDIRALVCIAVGATLGGVATWAMADARAAHADCVVEARAHSPRIVVTGQGDLSTILVAPDVRVRTHKRCGGEVAEIVEIHMDRQLEHLQEMEELELHLELVEKELEVKLEALEIPGPEFAFELQHDIQAEIELEMEKVKEELKKLHSGG